MMLGSKIPVPEFTDIQMKDIEKYFSEIKEACNLNNDKMIETLRDKIDDVIFEAFGLSDEECCQIRNIFAIYNSTTTQERNMEEPVSIYHNVTGEVLNINPETMSCLVYFAEFGEKELTVTNSMPGWFLRQNAEFSAKYFGNEPKELFEIKPLAYSYEDILKILLNDSEQGELNGKL